ncbi:MAG: glutathione binding-like protein, partial [Pseudomonadota bacterium]|nr:glutathione binding-like protein [Pseudomonadota bacterium]
EEVRQAAIERLTDRFAQLDAPLQKSDYLLGQHFTVVDGYLFTIMNWAGLMHIDLGRWAALGAYHARVGARPAVREALLAEGLVKG